MKSNTESALIGQEEGGGKVINISSLYNYLSRLRDGRKPRGLRYSLVTILVLIILAKLCGQDHPSGIADWAQQRTEYLVEVLKVKHKRFPRIDVYARRFPKGRHTLDLGPGTYCVFGCTKESEPLEPRTVLGSGKRDGLDWLFE